MRLPIHHSRLSTDGLFKYLAENPAHAERGSRLGRQWREALAHSLLASTARGSTNRQPWRGGAAGLV
jgi:hypothetical protein